MSHNVKPLTWSGQAPVLETARLRLRGRTLEDWPFSRDMWADPDVTRFISGPLSEEDSWGKFLRSFGHWMALGYGGWLVEEKQSGARLGEVGFMHYKRVMTPPVEPWPEMGWEFDKDAQGKGYATEAVLKAIEWGDAQFGGDPMICIISPQNSGSIRVAEKCGFKNIRRAVYHDSEVLVFHRGEGASANAS